MKKIILSFLFLLYCTFVQNLYASDSTRVKQKSGNLILPKGFRSIIVAENLGRARHLVVTNNGDLYVRLARLNKKGQGTVILRDKNKDGVIDDSTGFGNYGGTGIAIKNGYLYAASDNDVYRYKLNDKMEIIDGKNP